MLAMGTDKVQDHAECSTWVLSALSPWQKRMEKNAERVEADIPKGWKWVLKTHLLLGGCPLPRGSAGGRWTNVGVTVSCHIGKSPLMTH